MEKESSRTENSGLKRPLRILMAEDNSINLRVAMGYLRSMGVDKEDVDVAVNGEEALALLQQHQYDLIFMDCQMPVMDGFEATRRIRMDEEQAPDKPRNIIIALTANAMEGDREKCLTRGMDDYLAKPYTIDQLKALLDKWL